MEMAMVLPVLGDEGESVGDAQQHVSIDPFRTAMRVTTAAFVGLAVVSLGLAVAVGFTGQQVRTEWHGSDGLMEKWDDFSEDSVNKIFQIQSTSEKDYLYADTDVNAGSSGIGNDFKVHIHKSKRVIMLQSFRGKYVYWEVKDGVLSLSLKTFDGKVNGFIFYLSSGGPTFEFLMGGPNKLCRTKKEKGDSLVAGTRAKPCGSMVASRWTFKDVTSYYDKDGVDQFGNGKNNRIQPWEDFSQDSANKIFQIQSVSNQDYLYADKKVTAGSLGVGNDFKVHIHKSKRVIMLQGFSGKYVHWEVKDGAGSLSLKTFDGKLSGFIFYLTSGGPTFELMMGSSKIKLCREVQRGLGAVVGTPAKPCYNKGAGKWTFKDVTSMYDEDGVSNFGNGKNNRISK